MPPCCSMAAPGWGAYLPPACCSCPIAADGCGCEEGLRCCGGAAADACGVVDGRVYCCGAAVAYCWPEYDACGTAAAADADGRRASGAPLWMPAAPLWAGAPAIAPVIDVRGDAAACATCAWCRSAPCWRTPAMVVGRPVATPATVAPTEPTPNGVASPACPANGRAMLFSKPTVSTVPVPGATLAAMVDMAEARVVAALACFAGHTCARARAHTTSTCGQRNARLAPHVHHACTPRSMRATPRGATTNGSRRGATDGSAAQKKLAGNAFKTAVAAAVAGGKPPRAPAPAMPAMPTLLSPDPPRLAPKQAVVWARVQPRGDVHPAAAAAAAAAVGHELACRV